MPLDTGPDKTWDNCSDKTWRKPGLTRQNLGTKPGTKLGASMQAVGAAVKNDLALPALLIEIEIEIEVHYQRFNSAEKKASGLASR
jgi:hypothetical protein